MFARLPITTACFQPPFTVVLDIVALPNFSYMRLNLVCRTRHIFASSRPCCRRTNFEKGWLAVAVLDMINRCSVDSSEDCADGDVHRPVRRVLLDSQKV